MLGYLLVFFGTQTILAFAILWVGVADAPHEERAHLFMDAVGLGITGAILRYGLEPRIGFIYTLAHLIIAFFVLHALCRFETPRALLFSLLLVGLSFASAVVGERLVPGGRRGSRPAAAQSRLGAEAKKPAPAGAAVSAALPPAGVADPGSAEALLPLMNQPTAHPPAPAAAPRPSKPPPSASPANAVPAGDWEGARQRLRVGGTGRREGRTFILVDNRVVVPGDRVAVTYRGSNYSWQVSVDALNRVNFTPLEILPAPPPAVPKPRGSP